MSTLWIILGWIFAILFGLLTISMLLLRNWLAALVAFLLVLLCLPPVTAFLTNLFNITIHPLLRAVLILALLFIFGRLLLGNKVTSVYKSPQVQEQFMAIYDEKMKDWPLPYEDIFVDTEFGRIHVIATGPQEAPPMLLLHASGVSGWSWKFNIEELSRHYRTYAIDLVGDAGKSEFASMEHIMKTGEDQADLYAEISDKLDVEKAYVVGASEGGFIGSNYALKYPQRVEKLALLGPMGYSGATQSVIRIMFAQFFPLKPIQDSTFRWAFSDNPQLGEEYGAWFRLIMTGLNPVKVSPLPLAPEKRQGLSVPVLFVFGANDNLVGNPQKAKELVQDIPDVQVAIVEAGHLMASERPQEVNKLVLDFFANE